MPEANEPAWRLFIGIWPQPEVRTALVAQADRWPWTDRARRTRAERLHLTVHFIGQVPVARVPALQEGLRVAWSGCELSLDRATVWPGGIAVLEASGVPQPLLQLHADLAAALAALGLPVEQRPYRPHVTFARKAQGVQAPVLPPVQWPLAPNYVLVRTLPGGGGYAPVQAFD